MFVSGVGRWCHLSRQVRQCGADETKEFAYRAALVLLAEGLERIDPGRESILLESGVWIEIAGHFAEASSSFALGGDA